MGRKQEILESKGCVRKTESTSNEMYIEEYYPSEEEAKEVEKKYKASGKKTKIEKQGNEYALWVSYESVNRKAENKKLAEGDLSKDIYGKEADRRTYNRLQNLDIYLENLAQAIEDNDESQIAISKSKIMGDIEYLIPSLNIKGGARGLVEYIKNTDFDFENKFKETVSVLEYMVEEYREKYEESKKLEYVEYNSADVLDKHEFYNLATLEDYIAEEGYEIMAEGDEWFSIYDPRESDGNVYVYKMSKEKGKIIIKYDAKESYNMNESKKITESKGKDFKDEIENAINGALANIYKANGVKTGDILPEQALELDEIIENLNTLFNDLCEQNSTEELEESKKITEDEDADYREDIIWDDFEDYSEEEVEEIRDILVNLDVEAIDIDGHSVKIEDKGSGMMFWLDYTQGTGDIVGDWNQYIFSTFSMDDKIRKAIQSSYMKDEGYTVAFDQMESVGLSYLQEKGVVAETENGYEFVDNLKESKEIKTEELHVDQKEKLKDGTYHVKLVDNGHEQWFNVKASDDSTLECEYDYDAEQSDEDRDYFDSSVETNNIEDVILKAINDTTKVNEEKSSDKDVTIDSNIKEWYKKEYSDDELGDEIASNVTFNDIFKVLDNCESTDIYELLGVGDSIVRERVFSKIEKILGEPRGTCFELWLATPDEEVKTEGKSHKYKFSVNGSSSSFKVDGKEIYSTEYTKSDMPMINDDKEELKKHAENIFNEMIKNAKSDDLVQVKRDEAITAIYNGLCKANALTEGKKITEGTIIWSSEQPYADADDKDFQDWLVASDFDDIDEQVEEEVQSLGYDVTDEEREEIKQNIIDSYLEQYNYNGNEYIMEDWNERILPMIERQLNREDILVLLGVAETWGGSGEAGRLIHNMDEFTDLVADYDRVDIEDTDEGGIAIDLVHHDGTHCMNLYTFNDDYEGVFNKLKEMNDREFRDYDDYEDASDMWYDWELVEYMVDNGYQNELREFLVPIIWEI